MSKYAGTQTEKNLEAAFAGESQARNKYTYFVDVRCSRMSGSFVEMFRRSISKWGMQYR